MVLEYDFEKFKLWARRAICKSIVDVLSEELLAWANPGIEARLAEIRTWGDVWKSSHMTRLAKSYTMQDRMRKWRSEQDTWPELEKALLQHDLLEEAIDYAVCVRKGRWSELEDILIKIEDVGLVYKYLDDMARVAYVRVEWPEAGRLILSEGSFELVLDYWRGWLHAGTIWEDALDRVADPELSLWDFGDALQMLTKRWPALEQRLLEPSMLTYGDTGDKAVKYMLEVIGGLWPELWDRIEELRLTEMREPYQKAVAAAAAELKWSKHTDQGEG